MAERTGAPLFLLARFAEFFETVAGIKLAIREGRLGAMLAVGDEPAPSDPRDLAARVSGLLDGVLRAQGQEVARTGTPGEIDSHRMARYVMAALADEQFILELDWAGREAWLDVLLEYKLFGSRNAGVRFFDVANKLLATRTRDPLRVDLAAVMLLALQLGFKGQYRGEQGEGELRTLRSRLFVLVEREHGARVHGVAFPQALQQLLAGGTPARLAPLTPWYVGALLVLLGYLVISSALWLKLFEPFRQAVGSG